MRDLLFLVPLLIGLGIMLLALKFLKPTESGGHRILFGGALILGSLCWWWSGAMNLTWKGEFYVALDIFTICFFFLGCLCLIPKRKEPGVSNWRLWLVVGVASCGLLLGVAHALAMLASDTYPARLLAFYRSLGLTETQEKAEPVTAVRGPGAVPAPPPYPPVKPAPETPP